MITFIFGIFSIIIMGSFVEYLFNNEESSEYPENLI